MTARGKMAAFLAVASAALALQQAAPVIVGHLPTQAAYSLSPACFWAPRWWVRALGVDQRPRETMADLDRVFSCAKTHGMKSRTPVLKIILPRWPSKAELTAWEGQDHEDGDALHQLRR